MWRIGAFMITGCLAAYIVPSPSLAQLSPSPTRPDSVIIPADRKTEATMRSMEAQRPAFEAYQKCVAEYRREVDLHYAAADVIQFRDQRATMEAALKQDARARERYPGGAEQLIAAAFARYKSVGGTAASVAEVQPVPTPCPPPGLSLRQGSSPSAPSSIRETRRVVVVPVQQPGSPLASAPVGAEWAKVSDSFANTIYVDPSTIKRAPRTEKNEADEDIRTATQMLDFKIKTPDGPASYISVLEYDCKNRKTRTKSGNAYAGQAGTGKILHAVTPSDWTRQPANSPGTPMLTYVCSKVLPPLPMPSKSARDPR